MSLVSSAYFVFLAATFLLYWPLSRWRAGGLAALLFANYFALARWDIVYLFLIPAASIADFLIALALGRAERGWLRRLLVGASVTINLALIVVTKWAGTSWLLPLGLSFYAFQSLTYTIDVYLRDARPTSSLLAYLTATCFFPTVLAGPIARIPQLLTQLERPRPQLDSTDSGRALFLIAIGFAKKLLIADYLAENLVNRVFDFPNLYTGLETLLAVYGYAFQLYFDFSGYTDIALGSALLVGIRLPPNFNMPYAAANMADFWRRWHITFSNWLRDYLYFSLPGLRKPFWPYANLVITMALGGLWHGLGWNFLIWGLLHGFGLVAVRWLETRRRRRAPRLPHWLRVAVTFHFVCLTWVFFRAATPADAWLVLGRIGTLSASWANISPALGAVLLAALAGHWFPTAWYDRFRDGFARMPALAQAAALATAAIVIQSLAGGGAAPFIYSRF